MYSTWESTAYGKCNYQLPRQTARRTLLPTRPRKVSKKTMTIPDGKYGLIEKILCHQLIRLNKENRRLEEALRIIYRNTFDVGYIDPVNEASTKQKFIYEIAAEALSIEE